jgi:uncharacterized RDD family membrane protein YckC
METRQVAGPGGTVVLPEPARTRGLPQPGEQLGHYAVIRLLGAGGMGAVYEAEDLENGRRVALKVLNQGLDSPEARARFFREGRLAASINHPNSVYVFGTEEIAGTPVIAMELVPGGTLQDRVRSRGALPIGEAVDSVLQIIEGLEAAQRIGILHRDIKPSNCYTSEDGTVKIGDFGLSISTAVRTEPALTATGAFLGTPAFCSPEQLRGEELNARSDMYSVGATLYYLLTGRTPFEAKDMVQLLATVLEQRAPSPRKFRSAVPQGLAKAVLRCLEKQPGERFKSYADLAQALAPYSSTAPTPATFGLRFLAGCVDMAILGGLSLFINLLAFGSAMAFLDEVLQPSPKAVMCVVGWACLAILYYAFFEGVWGAAAGKALCRLRVVGEDRNPPGFARAGLRGLIYVLPPFLPYWAIFGANPKVYLNASQPVQMLAGFSWYVVTGLLFVTARRRNGFAAVHDLLSGTRVIARAALSARPLLAGNDSPPPSVESAVIIGPYHVLQPLAESADEKWFLAYDLKLLRKIWLRTVPAGTPPVPPVLRNLARIGRLRWLTGKRSPEENWDAFEGLNGQPFLDLVRSPQPWRDVRFWLHDLASEISAAEKEGSLPELALDRVWITDEGRAKLLDFAAPGLREKYETNSKRKIQKAQCFLDEVAAAALMGIVAPTRGAGDVAVPLPLHARNFLKSLSQLASPAVVAAALKPLLSRAASVSRPRRAALVGGCICLPAVAFVGSFFAVTFLQDIDRKYPGLMNLSSLLQMRTSARFWGGKYAQLPSDRQIEIYIASHYRGLITNESAWSSWMAVSMIKGEARKFAEQSIAQHSEPTEAEIKEADAAVNKHLPRKDAFASPFAGGTPPGLPMVATAACLLFYVGLPALLAALLFRGGLVLLICGVAYVRRDGAPASRLRLLWRQSVAWCPSFLLFVASILVLSMRLVWQGWLALALVGFVAAVSVALPKRGLQDHLAGTWPVTR